MALTVPRYTVDDLEHFPDDGNRYELLEGMLLVTPAARLAHNVIATRLVIAIKSALGDAAHLASPGVVLHADATQLEPDVLVFPSTYSTSATWRDIHEHWLAVEVLSPSSRIYDREFKRDAYLRLGVHAVWIVDIDDRSVEVTDAQGSRTCRERVESQLAGGVRVELGLDEIFSA